ALDGGPYLRLHIFHRSNLALIPTITTAIKWFPKNKGLAAGVIVSGYGGGSFIFNQVQTRFINPENFN
ncbi:Uncharacterized protein FKW44_001164, partial [Caligus rogercresseyi]